MRPIVWMSEALSRALCERLSETTIVNTAQEFIDAPRDAKTVSFLDDSTLEALDRLAVELAAPNEQGPPPEWRRLVAAVSLGPVIAICTKPIQTAISWLLPHPWLSHVISASMLEQTFAAEHLGNVMATLAKADQPKLLDWLGTTVAGRRIRLTHASKRTERLERMSEFFDSKGVGQQTVKVLRDAAEELLTNAFYDAPVAAGAQRKPISRSQDVSLPSDAACDMVYGSRDDLAIVRVRDPFGSLSRERLVEVLTRCSRGAPPAEADVSMGGSGQGLWRVFTTASIVAISVVGYHHTEVLVGVGKRASDGPRPYAFHFFFRGGAKRRFWTFADGDTGSPGSSVSVTVVPD